MEMFHAPIEAAPMSEPGLPGGGKEDDVWNIHAKRSGGWKKDPRHEDEGERHHSRNQDGIIAALGTLGLSIAFAIPESSLYNAAVAGLLKAGLTPLVGGFCAARIESSFKSSHPNTAIAGFIVNGGFAVAGLIRAVSALGPFGLAGLIPVGIYGVGFMIGRIKKKNTT